MLTQTKHCTASCIWDDILQAVNRQTSDVSSNQNISSGLIFPKETALYITNKNCTNKHNKHIWLHFAYGIRFMLQKKNVHE